MPLVRSNGTAMDEARNVASQIITQLDRIAERVEEQITRDQYIYSTGVGSAGADGDIAISMGPVRNGVMWIVERYAVTQAVGGAVAFYLDEVQPQNLVEIEQNAIAADFTDIYVPSGRNLIAHFYSQPVNQVCTVNLRIKEIVTNE